MTTDSNEIPKTLYHYTTMKGLIGIVKTKKLWGTNIHHLNDAAEFRYAAGLIVEKFENYLTTLPPEPAAPDRYGLDAYMNDRTTDPEKQAKIEILRSVYRAFGKIFRETILYHVYVCSFTENGDQLSQWRGYCPEGNCFSIGFKTDDLLPVMGKNSFTLEKCIYEPNIHDSLIDGIISKHMNLLKKELEAGPALSNMQATRTALSELTALIPQIKHATFEEEREWRFVKNLGLPKEQDSQSFQFREGKSMIIPYIEVALDNIPISEVYIGPTPHKETSKDSVELLLKANGFSDCEIKLSETPYRTW